MLEFLNTFSSLIKKQKVVIDTISHQLVYRVITMALLSFCAISQFRQFSSTPLTCITTGDQAIRNIADQFCHTVGTYTYAPPYDSGHWAINNFFYIKSEEQRSMWVEAYPGIRKSFPGSEPERIYHRDYTLVPIIFLFLAIINYLPHMAWRRMEGKLMLHLVVELNQAGSDEKKVEKCIEASARYFNGSIKEHKRYALSFFLVHVMYVVLILAQIALIYVITGTEYLYFGYEVMKHHSKPPEGWPYGLSRSFPLVTKCEFRYWSQTGDIKNTSNLCAMNLHEAYQLLFALYWGLLCVALVAESVATVFHAIKIVIPWTRRLELRYFLGVKKGTDAWKAVNSLHFGSGFVVHMMHKNIGGHVILQILEEISLHVDGTTYL